MTQIPDSFIYKYTTVLNAVHPDVLLEFTRHKNYLV